MSRDRNPADFKESFETFRAAFDEMTIEPVDPMFLLKQFCKVWFS